MPFERKILIASAASAISACATGSFTIADADFDPCRTQCSVIDWSETPACLAELEGNREVRSYFISMFEPLGRLEPPEGVCGCFIVSVEESGRLRLEELVYSNWSGASEFLNDMLAQAEPVGPLPPEATCMVGLEGPGAFAN